MLWLRGFFFGLMGEHPFVENRESGIFRHGIDQRLIRSDINPYKRHVCSRRCKECTGSDDVINSYKHGNIATS